MRNIQFFVREVARIKDLVYTHLGSHTGTGPEFRIKDFGQEFEGIKSYTHPSTIEATCDHGIVVNRLRRRLEAAGYLTGKDRFRDLYVHRKGQVTSLFEVKPDTSTTSIYTAIGQLLIHNLAHPRPSRMIFVVPDELSQGVREKLKKVGISVLGYRWVGLEPNFPGLANWKI